MDSKRKTSRGASQVYSLPSVEGRRSKASGYGAGAIEGPTANGEDAALMAVTPIDGRYHARTRALAAYFSEFALIPYRVRVQIEWLIALAENPPIPKFNLPLNPPARPPPFS